MNDSGIEEQLIDLIARKTGRELATIDRASTFYKLGIDGDDAAEFMEEYARIFGVDMTNFNPSSFYGPEAASIFFVGRPPDKDLSVDLLIRSAEEKKWLE